MSSKHPEHESEKATSPAHPRSSAGARSVDDEQGIEVLPIINLLLRNRRLILRPSLYFALAVGLLTLTIPPTYTATAKFISSGTPSTRATVAEGPGVAQRIGSNADLSSIDGMPEYYEALLQSSDFLKAALRRKYSGNEKQPSAWAIHEVGDESPDDRDIDALVPSLKSQISITNAKSTSQRTTILALKITGRDPHLIKQLANDLLDELSAYGGDARMQKAIKDRDFIQKQLNETEAKLRQDEAALANFSMRNRKIATPDLENEKTRLQRSVTVEEELFLSLKKQLETAKVRVQENVSILQILEQPTSIRTGPKRLHYVLVAFVLGIIFFGGKIYLRDWLGRLDESNTEVRELVHHLAEIRNELIKTAKTTLQSARSMTAAAIEWIMDQVRRLQSRRV